MNLSSFTDPVPSPAYISINLLNGKVEFTVRSAPRGTQVYGDTAMAAVSPDIALKLLEDAVSNLRLFTETA